MRNIEKYVTSIDLSKRLKELGMPQESCFYYLNGTLFFEPSDPRPDDDSITEVISAYLLEELFEIAKENEWLANNWITFLDGEACIFGENPGDWGTPSQAIIYGLENNILTFKS